ncbi:cupin domain-containing protein [Paracidobacterium acidisoli]|uniref:cupin domain-containing protein n=1 Tax=Paracidobacterium acidisoli TaxID=2303751 RepID=UPI00207AB5DA|nr:cupin domain-containing protein [Paracidobacterium acidisoli]
MAVQTVSRRNFLGAGSVAVATAAFAGLAAHAQQSGTAKAEHDHSSSNPGQENRPLLDENPASNMPPPTDHGDIGAIWYSFDLAHKRVQEGGWTHEVTQRQLPLSKDIAGVNMRLTAGSYRELHWHTADEWAFMLYGSARITVLSPDGTIFIDDVSKGDLWFFPAGFPHSIQGLGPDGCEFLLVFDEGAFAEDNTFLLSEWVAHTPPDVLMKNFNLPQSEIAKLPKDELYIFPSDVPGSLAQARAAAGGASVASPVSYTFKMGAMAPTKKTAGGEVRVVDSHNFPVSKSIAAGLVTLKPGGLRELHWHPNASEWQFYLSGKGRMTVFMPPGRARTMDFNANDVGFVPAVAGHYIENTGDTDLVFLEMFKADTFADFSLNNWLRRLPPQMVTAHLNLDEAAIRRIPSEKQEVIAG